MQIMRILAYKTLTHNGKVQLLESTGDTVESNNLDTLFSFLLEQFNGCIRVCWSLDETVAPLLKLLGESRCRRLHETNKCYYPPFTVFYIAGKVFSVTHIPSKARTSLYDLEQYFPELESPNSIEETEYLGRTLLEALKKMGLKPTKLTSPVAIYEECVMSQLDLPKVTDMPQEATEFAYRCSGHLLIEAHQLGYFETTYDYDQVSSFPSAARDLIDIRYCDWIKSSEYQPSAVYSYCKCEVTIYDWVEISPILKETEDGGLISPVGTWETYLTMSEIAFIKKWQIGEVKIIEGWWCIPK